MTELCEGRDRVESFVRAVAQALLAACVFASLPGCSDTPSFARDPARPNIVVVTLDTTRPDRLGCYGHAAGNSPQLDRLCADAVVHTRAYSTSSWTLPAHASLFTGLHTSAHGATNDPQGPLLLADVLPEKAAAGHRVRGLSDEAPTLAESAAEAGYATAGFVAGPWMKRAFGLARGFEHWDDAGIDALNGRRAEALSEAALTWLSPGHERPFLLFLNYYDPHSPFDPPAAWRPAGAPPSGHTPNLDEAWALYDAEIRYMDHELGRVLDALRSWRLYDDALVVVTADHGELMGEHGVAGHGRFLYEEEIRIPLIVKWPRGTAARETRDTILALSDLPRILLPSFGASVPELASRVRPLVAELEPAPQFAGRGNWRSLIEWPYKFVWNSRGKHRLYDLSRTQSEDANRIASEPERAAAMAARLEAYIASLPAPRPADASGEVGPIDDETRRALEGLGYVLAPDAGVLPEAAPPAASDAPAGGEHRDARP